MLTAWIAALLSIPAFIAVFSALNVATTARAALDGAGEGVSAMLNPDLDDDAKEKAVQQAGIGLLKSTFQIFWRFAATLIAAAAPVYLFDLLGFASLGATLDVMLGWPFLIGVTAAVCVLVWIFGKRGAAADSNYSGADQIFHKIAFSGPGAQLSAAGLEDRIFAGKLKRLEATPPIFITALPRAGTTVLLNALFEAPGVATHLYRDMPFVMAPLLWSRVSSPFAKRGEMTERAHGDGLMVGFDSPEAFEEVIWRAFWPEHFSGERVRLFSAEDARPEALKFLTAHFKKVRLVRGAPDARYVSKNNGNIARLPLLRAMFPDCRIVTPIRTPAEHAGSFLRQHLNFTKQHAEDPFAARYMRDIGHLEFGALHKPIDFPGFDPAGLKPEEPDYWLAYWIAAHRAIAAEEGLILIRHASLCENPGAAMRGVCQAVGIDPGETNFDRHFRPIGASADRSAYSAAMLAEAEAIYETLAARETPLG